MNTAQRSRVYFPAWARAVRARGWRMERGHFLGQREECFASPELNATYQAAWDAAEQLARRSHHGLTQEDLRHGQHVAVLGRDMSCLDLDNAQLDKLLIWFRVLENPDDLDAVLAWTDPSSNAKRRFVYALHRAADEDYVRAIAADKFAKIYRPPFWEDLPIWALKQLLMTVKGRKAEVGKRKAEMVEEPF